MKYDSLINRKLEGKAVLYDIDSHDDPLTSRSTSSKTEYGWYECPIDKLADGLSKEFNISKDELIKYFIKQNGNP